MPRVPKAILRRTPILLLLIVFQAVGCGDDAVLGDAEVELGTGTVTFTALEDGSPLAIVAGPQGGFHFVVHARARGIVPGEPRNPGLPSNPRTTFAAFLGDEQVDLELPPYRLGYEVNDGSFTLPSGRILQLEQEVIPGIYDQDVRITVTVTDEEGDTASDERTVRAYEAPLDQTSGPRF